MDSQMFLGRSPNQNVTMPLGGHSHHPDRQCFSSSKALGFECDPSWWLRPQGSADTKKPKELQSSTQGPSDAPGPQTKTWSLVTSHNPGPASLWTQMISWQFRSVHSLITLTSPDLPLSPAHKPFRHPLPSFYFHTLYSGTTMVPNRPAPVGLLVDCEPTD